MATLSLTVSRRDVAHPSRLAAERLAGAFLVMAGSLILLAIITAEALYPAPYTTGGNEISDLGGTRLPEALVLQPSAAIFDLSMIAIGVLIVGSAVGLHRAFRRRAVTIPVLVLGLGALGVGLFPGNTGIPHAIASMVTFIAGGVAALCSGLVTRGATRWAAVALGGVSLAVLATSLLLGDASPFMILGIGGLERWVVYPIVLWTLSFGGWLDGQAAKAADDPGPAILGA